MPNVSRRPAQPGKPQSTDKTLDTQEQLKKLRENLLRDAGPGEGETSELSKKELAARRFAGVKSATSSRAEAAQPERAQARGPLPDSNAPRADAVSREAKRNPAPGTSVEPRAA